MTKKRQKRRASQQARRKAKAKARKKAFRQRQAAKVNKTKKLAHALETLAGGKQVPDITDDEHLFWICHGVNCLVSNIEDGVWDPMFEDIYRGRELPSTEDITARVMSRYDFESEDSLPPMGQAVLAWTVADKATVRIYKFEAERRILEKDPETDAKSEAMKPANSVVWGVFSRLKEKAEAAARETAASADQSPCATESPE